jgi:hypothetical protein
LLEFFSFRDCVAGNDAGPKAKDGGGGLRILNAILGSFLVLAAGAGAHSAQAEVLAFHATLDGKSGADATGSAATGTARITADTESRRVSVDLTLDGITMDALWDRLVAAPIGPVHFHKYATPEGGDAVLVLPVPFGAGYSATPTGLRVTMSEYDYAAGAKLLNSKLTFEDFVAAMRSGLVVLNVHTDAFNPGEIRGVVAERNAGREAARGPLPAGQPHSH